MKTLEEITFEPAQCQAELAAFKALLLAKAQLTERGDLQPFFKKSKQLSAFIGTFAPNIGPATHLAFEFPFMGDFAADIVLGSKKNGAFCVIELEDGKTDSIFKRAKKKTMTEWGRRFEHGFSQIVDWCCSLDDFKKTDRFAKDFGHGHVAFIALLILGRSAGVSGPDRNRPRWRAEKVRVDSHAVECLTFDDLYEYLERRMSYYPQAPPLGG